jgi:hypothetical protein
LRRVQPRAAGDSLLVVSGSAGRPVLRWRSAEFQAAFRKDDDARVEIRSRDPESTVTWLIAHAVVGTPFNNSDFHLSRSSEVGFVETEAMRAANVIRR